jgi:Zn finger protein HypA/HybF involved in hydrogenase expression
MSILGTVREFFEGADTSTATDGSKGAYWCHDCDERVRDVDLDGEAPPACPSCGADMEFERSVCTSGCAC